MLFKSGELVKWFHGYMSQTQVNKGCLAKPARARVLLLCSAKNDKKKACSRANSTCVARARCALQAIRHLEYLTENATSEKQPHFFFVYQKRFDKKKDDLLDDEEFTEVSTPSSALTRTQFSFT